MPTNPLSPAQLAEGSRLLAEFKSDPTPRTFSAWAIWRTENGEALLLRAAEVEGCVREIVRGLEGHADGACALGLKNRSLVFREVITEIRDLAARHNIDLSEPTQAGEPTKGSP